MANTIERARHWLELISRELKVKHDLSTHVAAGRVVSVCSCGCHGFGFEVPEGVNLTPLQEGAGLLCEMAFASNYPEEVDVLVFTDKRGYFAGADVTYGAANIDPMPDDIEVESCKGVW